MLRAARLLLTTAGLAAGGARAASVPDALDAAYFRRDRPGVLEEHLGSLDSALAASPSDAGLLWRRCRAKVRLGERRAAKRERLADYEAARADCERAAALAPDTADARFWLGVSMGRWGEAKGIMKALFLVKPIRREMEAALRLDPSHGGAHHVLGEVLWQLPGFAGGDKKKALTEFEAAVRLSPAYTANHVPLAEAYLHFGREDEAVAVLRAVEAVKEPADPAEYPENLADARALLEKIRR